MEPYVYDMLTLSASFWCLVMSVFAAILWARVKGTEHFFHEAMRGLRDDIEKFEAKVPEARLQELESALQAFRTRIDQSALENNAYREQVHKSMQRFDQIMRRNERALIKGAEKSLTDEDVDDTPDEIPLGDVAPPQTGRNRPSRAELRAQLRRKRP